MRFGRVVFKLFLLTGLLVPFQNCGKPFKSAELASATSSQCQAKLRESAPSLQLNSRDFNCGDFNSYGCERRIFRPHTSSLSESIKECLPGGETCVDVEVRQFDTSGLITSSPPGPTFYEGGEYNREEVQCYHRGLYEGVSLFVGSADSLEESLALAMAACERAVSQ
jgi:hypothetical protein